MKITIETLQRSLAHVMKEGTFDKNTVIALSSDAEGNSHQPILEFGQITDESGQHYLVLYPSDGDEIVPDISDL